ncbi:hypothetical protein CU097_013362 [Rhizopus azygosporus]|nr:hypothetical protein CU097_013362 [Rhizopus azygosporus]
MNTEPVNRYLEFRKTSTKIGLEEALVQFKTIGQPNWKFELLCELFFIVNQVQNETTERTNVAIRSFIKLLNSEPFISEHSKSIVETVELFQDIEYQETSIGVTRYLVEGLVYLPTRAILIKTLSKSSYVSKENTIHYALSCAYRLNSKFMLQLSEMMGALVEANPEYAWSIRLELMEMKILPDVITRITAVYCQDEINFFNSIFQQVASWFLAQSAASRQYFLTMKNRIISEIEVSHSNGDYARVASAIRALAGITGYFGVKLNDQEVDVFINLLNQTESERLVQLILCLVLITADQFLKRQKNLSEALCRLLQCNISEMPLLILVYFETDAIFQVEDTVRSTIAIQVPIPRFGLFEIQKLFRSLKNSVLPIH